LVNSTPAENIGRYKVIRKIAEGTTGVVYLVTSEGKEFALKLLKTSDADTLVRFRRESSTLARLNQENLIRIYDVGEFESAPFMVMDYLDGKSVEDELKGEAFSVEKSLETTRALIKALGELHKNNLVHRDIKPANIYRTLAGQTKLIDFGLVGDVEQIKSEVGMVGTPLYCALEQSRILKRPVDFRSDLYSVGIVLFEMLTGRTPFLGTLTELLQAHATRMVPDPRELNPSISPALSLIIAKLLAKDPDDRYQSLSGLAHDIERIPEIEKDLKQGLKPKLGQADRPTLTTRAKFIERKAEAKLLASQWHQVTSGLARCAVVTGPSGSGKTALVQDFLKNAEASTNQLLVLKAKCQFFDRGLPFAAFREAIDNLAEEIVGLPENKAAEMKARIATAAMGFESELCSLSKSFRKILPADVALVDRQSNLEGDAEMFLSNISGFMNRLAQNGAALVLFIDDLQWLDPASVGLLRKLFEQDQKIRFFLLATARNDHESQQLTSEIRSKLEMIGQEEIRLSAFDRTQMHQLLVGYLGSDKFDDSVAGEIFQKSKGNPFIAIEYIRAGVEQGFLTFRAETWFLNQAELEKIALSDDVYGLIMRRIDNASAESKLFLQFAALYGNSFNHPDIAVVSGLSDQEARDILENCHNLALIEKLGESRWKFVHDKIPESLLSSVEEDRKKLMSDQLALHLFSKTQMLDEEVFIAARRFASGNLEKHADQAVLAHIAAGNLVFGSFAYKDAYPFFKLAFDLFQKTKHSVEMKADIAQKLAISATMYGDGELARSCIDLYVRLAKTDRDRIHGLAVKVWILESTSQLISAWEHFRIVSNMIGKPHPSFLHWKFVTLAYLWTLSLILQFIPIRIPVGWYFKEESVDMNRIANLYRDIFANCEQRLKVLDYSIVAFRLLVMGQLVGGSKERALGYTFVGLVYSIFGLRRISSTYFARAQQMAAQLNDPTVMATCQMRKLIGSVMSGELNDYSKEYEEKKAFFQKYLSPVEMFRLTHFSAYQNGQKGFHHEAAAQYVSLIDSIDRKSFFIPEHFMSPILNQAWSHLELAGRSNESQRFKKLGMAKCSEFRFCPGTGRSLAAAEISVRHISEDTDNVTEELVAWWGRGGAKIGDHRILNTATQMVSLRLLQFERAEGFERKFSTRRELKRCLRQLFLTTYGPVYRVNYYFLKGSYNRAIKNHVIAELYFKKAEKLAAQTGSLRILYLIQRERARIYRDQGRAELMKVCLGASAAIALKHHWMLDIDLLRDEFGNEIDLNFAMESSVSATASTIHSTIVRKSVAASSVHWTTVHGGDRRFVDALLNVSSAFVGSTDPDEQAKSVLGEIIKLFASERGFIFSYDDDLKSLRVMAGKGSEGEELHELKGFSSTVVREVIETGKPKILTGTETGEVSGSESIVLNNLRSIMATPLTSKGKPIGVVYLDSSMTKGLFTKDDIELFATLANHISVAFELSRQAKIELEKVQLQKQVEIQSAIAAESKKVAILVDNMKQAMFSVKNGAIVVDPVSKYSSTVLGTEVAGKDIFSTLFHDFNEEEQAYQRIHSVLNTVYGEDEIQWMMMEDNIPKKLKYTMPGTDKGAEGASQRTLKISPSPIWDGQGLLDKILFVIEDVTDLETFEAQLKMQRLESMLLEEVLKNSFSESKSLIERAIDTLVACRRSAMTLNKENLRVILRDLHTLKGNARLFNMDYLSKEVHNSESKLVDLSGQEVLGPDEVTRMTEQLGHVDSILSKYRDLLSKLTPSQELAGAEGVDGFAVAQLNELKELLSARLEDDLKAKFVHAVDSFGYKSINSLARQYERMAEEIAKQIDKQVKVVFKGNALFEEKKLALFQECLLHLVRNSLDHGIESPEDRVRLGKPAEGSILVESADVFGKIKITISDDGRGIDPDKVLAKAIQKGIVDEEKSRRMSKDERMNLIFLPGFSTKDAASEISGRGIGLDVVKSNIELLGGHITIDATPGKGSTFIINLSEDLGADFSRALVG
jgi:signal transduction histidine kinase/Cdc6-like AAA superfamily ATPase